MTVMHNLVRSVSPFELLLRRRIDTPIFAVFLQSLSVEISMNLLNPSGYGISLGSLLRVLDVFIISRLFFLNDDRFAHFDECELSTGEEGEIVHWSPIYLSD